MSRDFFDELTDLAATGQRRPLDAEETALAAELQPVLHLLSRAAPENGINLVPAWQVLLAKEMAAEPQLAPMDPVKPRYTDSWWRLASYAAVLVFGVGLGTIGSSNFKSQAAGLGVNESAFPSEHYSANEKQLMFAVLDSATAASPKILQVASVDLARCITCHDALAGVLVNSPLDLLKSQQTP